MKQLSNLSARLAAHLGILVLGAGLAHAQNTRFYVQGDLGGNVTEDLDLKEFFGPVAPGSKVKLDPGLRAGVRGGYQVCDYFAPEVELGFYGNRIDSITGATRVHDASFANVPFLLNARLQYPNRSRLTPYIGGGVGFAESLLSVDEIVINDIHVHGDNSDTVFAYQAFAGLRFTLNPQMGISLEYHYFVADSPKWQSDFSFGTPSDTMSFGRSYTHAASIAFDFRF